MHKADVVMGWLWLTGLLLGWQPGGQATAAAAAGEPGADLPAGPRVVRQLQRWLQGPVRLEIRNEVDRKVASFMPVPYGNLGFESGRWKGRLGQRSVWLAEASEAPLHPGPWKSLNAKLHRWRKANETCKQ